MRQDNCPIGGEPCQSLCVEPCGVAKRPCTCHPDDNPPVPCAKRYALSECRAAQSANEPIAWMIYTLDGKSVCVTDNPHDFTEQYLALPLYTHPPIPSTKNATPPKKRIVTYVCPVCAASLERQE